MSNLNFPAFTSHENAKESGCSRCYKPLPGEHKDDGYANGRGKYCLHCPSCGVDTWYDIKDKGEGLTQARAKEIYLSGNLWQNWEKKCTEYEDIEILALWCNMPGNTSWLDALLRFVQGRV